MICWASENIFAVAFGFKLFALRVPRRGRLDTGGLDDRMIRCLMKINGTLMEIDSKSTEIDGKSMKFNEHRWEPT